MGYQRPLLNIKFADDTEFAGLEVKARRPNLALLLEFEDVNKKAAIDKIALITKFFLATIVSWNLEDAEGNPVSVDASAIDSVDFPLINIIVGEVASATVSVTNPLPTPSKDGDSSLVVSIPMETL